MSELYRAIAGSPITYLAADISANQTTISIVDDSALPDAPNICTIGYGENIETIRYGAKSNGVLQNVTRGLEGTPRAWKAGTEVARFYTAYEHNAIVETITSHLAEDVFEGNPHGIDAKANKEPPPFNTATLQNEWTGTLNYRINEIGQIELRWRLSPGITSPGTTRAQLPDEYSLSRNIPLPSTGADGGVPYFPFALSWDGKIVTTSVSIRATSHDGVIVIPK